MEDPDSYDSFSDYQRRDALDFIPYIVSQMKWKSGERILDFGCGSGYNTRHVLVPALENRYQDEYRRLQAWDISPNMIEFAKIKYQHPNITYRVVDLVKEDEDAIGVEFDKIFSFHVFHWISDWEKLLCKLNKLLKVDGEIAFYFLSGGGIFSAYDAMSKHPKWSSFITDVRKFIPQTFFSEDPGAEMRRLMASNGFHVFEAAAVPRMFSYKSTEELIGSAMAANPWYPRIPDNLKGQFRDDFQEAFAPFFQISPTAEHPKAVQGPSQVLLVRAKKVK